jgi:hypothetical protein
VSPLGVLLAVARDLVPALGIANVAKIVWGASLLFGFAESNFDTSVKIFCISALLRAGCSMRAA